MCLNRIILCQKEGCHFLRVIPSPWLSELGPLSLSLESLVLFFTPLPARKRRDVSLWDDAAALGACRPPPAAGHSVLGLGGSQKVATSPPPGNRGCREPLRGDSPWGEEDEVRSE